MAAITPPFTTLQLFAALVVLSLASMAILLTNSRRNLPGSDSPASTPAFDDARIQALEGV